MKALALFSTHTCALSMYGRFSQISVQLTFAVSKVAVPKDDRDDRAGGGADSALVSRPASARISSNSVSLTSSEPRQGVGGGGSAASGPLKRDSSSLAGFPCPPAHLLLFLLMPLHGERERVPFPKRQRKQY